MIDSRAPQAVLLYRGKNFDPPFDNGRQGPEFRLQQEQDRLALACDLPALVGRDHERFHLRVLLRGYTRRGPV